MLIYVDIDETICESPKDRDYAKATPVKDRIEKINKLFDEGNTIVYWTARGTMTGINWYEVTKKQFQTWGCNRTQGNTTDNADSGITVIEIAAGVL